MMAEDLNAIVDRAMTALDAALRIAEDAPDEIEDAILSWQDRAVAEGHAAEAVEVLCDVVRDAIRQACEHWDGRCSVRALDWRQMSLDGKRFGAEAFGIDTFYMVSGEPGDWTLTHPQGAAYGHTPGYGTQAGAKEAAQVDFERRVQASLADRSEGFL